MSTVFKGPLMVSDLLRVVGKDRGKAQRAVRRYMEERKGKIMAIIEGGRLVNRAREAEGRCLYDGFKIRARRKSQS